MSTLLNFFIVIFSYSISRIQVQAFFDETIFSRERNNIDYSPSDVKFYNTNESTNRRAYRDISHGRKSNEDHDNRDSSVWHFGYRNLDEWSNHERNCSGRRQSPIDLKSRIMTKLRALKSFHLNGYRIPPKNMTIVNNGHTVQLNGIWEDNKAPYIYGGVLKADYVFQQLHFHWSSSDDVGSEHTLNNRAFPLEMHMVHYKRDYGSASEALKHDDGLAVVGFFFEISDKRNGGLYELEKYARGIKYPGSPMEIKPFTLFKFTGRSIGAYMAYQGSLTTPPCSEIVTWILPAVPRSMTRKQLDLFQSFQLAHRDSHNFRPTQPLNGRKIYYIRDR